MAPVETLRGYVNTWDCDENDHLNVQFYFRFFEDASAHFQMLAGAPAAARRRPVMRHVRYHRELRSNDAIRIESHAVAGSGGLRLAHMMYMTAGDALAATCLETLPEAPPDLAQALVGHEAALPEAAMPRSIGAEPVAPGPEGAAPDGGRVTLRTRVRAGDCGPDGRIEDWPFIGRNSDSAANFWDMIGIDRPWLDAHGRGRVAVEMKLCRLADLRHGDLLHVVSRPIAVARSTVSFENRFVRSETGTVAAVVQLTALTMNLTTRRAEPLPDETRAAIEAQIAARA